MNPELIAKGTKVLIGAPSRPMPRELVDAIAELVQSHAAVAEAHLPQVYVPGQMKMPAQVLVIVAAEGSDPNQAIHAIGEGLQRILPAGMSLDVWPLEAGSPLLESVRAAGCPLGGVATAAAPAQSAMGRPWWRFWGE